MCFDPDSDHYFGSSRKLSCLSVRWLRLNLLQPSRISPDFLDVSPTWHPTDEYLKKRKTTWKSGDFPHQLVQPSLILNARRFKLVQVKKESIVFRWSISLNNFSLENMGPFLLKLLEILLEGFLPCQLGYQKYLGRCKWPQVLHEKHIPKLNAMIIHPPQLLLSSLWWTCFERFGDAVGNSYVPGTATGLLWRSAKLWRIGATFSLDRSCGAQISRHSAGLDGWWVTFGSRANDSSDGWIVGIWSKWYKLDPWKVLWKGGDIPKKQGAKGTDRIGDSASASNFHESDRWSREIWWIAIDGNSRIAVVFYAISCLVNDLIRFIYHMQFESMEFACSFHFWMKCWQLSLQKHSYDFEISEAFSILFPLKCVHSPNSCKWRFRANICQQASFTWSLPSVVTPRCLQNSDLCQVLYGFTPNTPLLNDTKSLVNVLLDGQRFPGRVPLAPKKKPWNVREYQRLDMLL